MFASDPFLKRFILNAPRFFLALTLAAGWVSARSFAAGESHPTANPNAYALHPAFEMKLFAAEPDVVDPVALTFDEFGRAYVVEMRDYPLGIGPAFLCATMAAVLVQSMALRTTASPGIQSQA